MQNVSSSSWGWFLQLKPSKKYTVKVYKFDPENVDTNWLYKFRFYIATYTDTNEMNQTFELIRKTPIEHPQAVAGLTYTNDYVIKTTNQIYWLDTGCPYEFLLHKKMSRILVDVYQIKNIQKSILCQCGGRCFYKL